MNPGDVIGVRFNGPQMLPFRITKVLANGSVQGYLDTTVELTLDLQTLTFTKLERTHA